MKTFQELRKQIPMLDQRVNNHPLIYFDNAATTHKPQAVIDAMVNFYAREYGTVHRSVYDAGEQATSRYELARATVARFINADSDELIFTSGSTAGINMIARTWAQEHIKPGDEILISELEHHSNIVPWLELARRVGAQVRYIPIHADGSLNLENINQLINARTKLVAISAVSNALGVQVDVARIISAAHAMGARVLVDATQLVPHARIDVKNLTCDFLVFSAHKMMGPTGIGALFIKKELHHETPPEYFGGGMVYEVDAYRATYKKAPHCYEAGTPPIAQAIGFAAAVDFMNQYIDFALLQKHEAQLCTQLIDGLQKIPGVTILGPVEELKNNGHLVSFTIKAIHSHDVSAYLNARGIAVRAGHHCAQPLAKKMGIDASVRVSFYWYNTAQEVAQLLAILKEIAASL